MRNIEHDGYAFQTPHDHILWLHYTVVNEEFISFHFYSNLENQGTIFGAVF